MNGRNKRTRWKCAHPSCGLSLCLVGTGKADEDCFALSHATDEVLAITKRRHEASKAKTNVKFK